MDYVNDLRIAAQFPQSGECRHRGKGNRYGQVFNDAWTSGEPGAAGFSPAETPTHIMLGKGPMKTMAGTIDQIVAAAVLTFLGWVAGRAQTSAPAFEVVVDAPGGETTIKCVRGCELAWVERGVHANAMPGTIFAYRCTAPRCSSGRVGGWLKH